MRLEHEEDIKESMQILFEMQNTNQDNALYLRMIFERFDRSGPGDAQGV